MNTTLVKIWGQIAISVASLFALYGCLVAAFFAKDPAMMQLLVGAVIGYAGAVVTFWVGSSASSQSKDEPRQLPQIPPRA
jgi:ribose/xylose/arabinose/galactoside ABC-type transport system permease subunit